MSLTYVTRTPCTIVIFHNYNGNFAVVEIREDEDAFFARQKKRLINEFGLVPEQAEKMIRLRDKIADVFIDQWMGKNSHALSKNDDENRDQKLHNPL